MNLPFFCTMTWEEINYLYDFITMIIILCWLIAGTAFLYKGFGWLSDSKSYEVGLKELEISQKLHESVQESNTSVIKCTKETQKLIREVRDELIRD